MEEVKNMKEETYGIGRLPSLIDEVFEPTDNVEDNELRIQALDRIINVLGGMIKKRSDEGQRNLILEGVLMLHVFAKVKLMEHSVK